VRRSKVSNATFVPAFGSVGNTRTVVVEVGPEVRWEFTTNPRTLIILAVSRQSLLTLSQVETVATSPRATALQMPEGLSVPSVAISSRVQLDSAAHHTLSLILPIHAPQFAISRLTLL